MFIDLRLKETYSVIEVLIQVYQNTIFNFSMSLAFIGYEKKTALIHKRNVRECPLNDTGLPFSLFNMKLKFETKSFVRIRCH